MNYPGSLSRGAPWPRWLPLILMFLLAGAIQFAGTARGAVYMKIEGVAADTSDARFSGWSRVLGLGQKVERVANPDDPTQPPISVTSCLVRKRIDQVTPGLLKRCGEGTPITRVVFLFEENGVVLYRVVLENVLVSSLRLGAAEPEGGEEGSVPMEQLSLNFTKISWSSVLIGDRGEVLGGSSTSFDSTTGAGADKDRLPFRAEVSTVGGEAGVVRLRCPVEKGRRYRVAMAPDLAGQWQPALEFTAEEDGVSEQTIRNLPPVAFLRIEEIE